MLEFSQEFPEETEPSLEATSWQTFSIKGQRVSILGFAIRGHIVISIATIKLLQV